MKELTPWDFKVLAAIVRAYAQAQQRRWNYLDGLYCERFYLAHRLSRLLHAQHRLSDGELETIWSELDQRMAKYDDQHFFWLNVIASLRDLICQLSEMAGELERENAM